MEVSFKGGQVSSDDIIAALRDFKQRYPSTNDYKSWLVQANYKFAIAYNGKLYPCKYILSQATGIDVSEFSGGEQTNRIFQQLGFTIIEKPATVNEA